MITDFYGGVEEKSPLAGTLGDKKKGGKKKDRRPSYLRLVMAVPKPIPKSRYMRRVSGIGFGEKGEPAGGGGTFYFSQ